MADLGTRPGPRLSAAFPYAVGAQPLEIRLDMPVPEMKGDGWEQASRRYYASEAERFVDVLIRHAPGGLVDAIFGELAHRKASLFRVPHLDPKG